MVRLLWTCSSAVLLVGCAWPAQLGQGPIARLERALIYMPVPYPAGDWDEVCLPVEDAWFTAADGTQLHGWYWPCERPRDVVLYAHGNAGNVSHCAGLLRRLHDGQSLSVMVFDYRGFGRSGGEPDEPGILADARAARAWLARRAGVAEADIVLMGRSLGGAVMVDLAAADGARGLILESTFPSLAEVVSAHKWWVVGGWLMRSRLDSLSKIHSYRGPLLQSHGEADSLIPIHQGRQLFEAANEPKRFVTIAGAGHNDPQSAEYYAALAEFIDALPAADNLHRLAPVGG